MKKTFNNQGVYALQREVLQTTSLQKEAIIDQIKDDFCLFMLEYFLLSSTQIQYLNNLSDSFIHHLSTGIAYTWSQNQLVLFAKDEPQEGEHIKDIITRPSSSTHPPIADEDPFLIWIRYRSK